MPMRTDDQAFDLDEALTRLAAEAGPRPALQARVLADAAMVSAERRPAPAPTPERAGLAAQAAGFLRARPLGAVGAAATVAVSLALVLGFSAGGNGGMANARLDDAALSRLSPLDGIEREIMATLDEDLLDLDAPL